MSEFVIGSAVTGAKFTPRNHRPIRDPIIDAASSGATIRHRLHDLADEAQKLSDMGCRYYHYHARNPETNEQTTQDSVYSQVSSAVQQYDPAMTISFGASRNGHEVKEAILRHGEWERVSQAGLPLHLGGAHFVTTQAAVELQVILDIERRHGKLNRSFVGSAEFDILAQDYRPSPRKEAASLDTYSTAAGSDYGSTSPATQLAVMGRSIAARNRLYLPHEIEWVQLDRSYAATRLAITRPDIGLGSNGQLAITLLFGFAPAFPFPHSYREFLDAVNLAKSVEHDSDGVKRRDVTISVGAAVIPQHCHRHSLPLDVDADLGRVVGPMERIVHYACQDDSRVDIIRCGMEDTPYQFDPEVGLALSDNVALLSRVKTEMAKYGAEPLVSRSRVLERLRIDKTANRLRDDTTSAAAAVEGREPGDRSG